MFVLPQLEPVPVSGGFWGPPESLTSAVSFATSTVLKEFQHIPATIFSKGERFGRVAEFEDPQAMVEAAMADKSPSERRAAGNVFKVVEDPAKAEALLRKKRQEVTAGISTGRGRGGRGMGGGRGGPPGFNRGGAQAGGRGAGGYHGAHNRKPGDGPTRRVEPYKKMTVDIDRMVIVDSLNMLTKVITSPGDTVPIAFDLKVTGNCRQFDAEVDKILCKRPVRLKEVEFKDTIYRRDALNQDEVIQQLAMECEGSHPVVFTTESVLATLMTSRPSGSCWDVAITRIGRFFFMDSRDDDAGNLDVQWVHETSPTPPPPPSDNDPSAPNTTLNLATESTKCNKFFSSHVLKPKVILRPGATKSSLLEPQSRPTLFVYRKWTLTEGKTSFDVIARCEIDAAYERPGAATQTIRSFGLLENPNGEESILRNKLDEGRGAMIARENKLNTLKVAKWTLQSILSGADAMKIAFITRTEWSDPVRGHDILAVETKEPKTFGSQIGINMFVMWTTFRRIVNKVFEHAAKLPDGTQFGLAKEPHKPILTLFYDPAAVANDEAGDGDEDDDDDDNTA